MQATDGELLQLLTALSSGEKAPRTAAEQALAAGQLQHGFPARLAAFAAAGPAGQEALPLRQLGLTVLKRLSLEHWPELAEDDRAAVRQAVLGALAEEAKGLRGLLHACAANIRSRGGPWPELHVRLSEGIVQGTPHEATCCLECVAVLLEECSADVAAALAPLQEPMLRLASSEAAQPALRCQCVHAHMAGVNAVLGGGGGLEAAETGIIAGLPPWLAVHAMLCTGQEGWDDASRVSCAFTAIRTVTSFSRLPPLEVALAGPLEAVLRPACLLVQRLEAGYEQAVICTDDGGASEEDGGVAQLVTQLMELLQAMLARPKLRAILKGHVRSMLQLVVPFMRITEAQVKAWRADPNEFLAHEEDDYVRGCAVRLSGESLVGELLSHQKRESMRALASVAGELLERGERGREAGEASAWKLAEVALFLFGNAAAELQPRTLQRGDLAPLVPTALTTAGGLCGDATAPEFLRARAFAVLRRLGDAVCVLAPAELPALLQASASALAPTQPLVVRVCALRAFCRFLSAVNDAPLRESLLLEQGVLASLGSLAQEADEELLHLTLESLCVIVRQCPGAMVAVTSSLTPLILEIWRRCASDPMVHLQVLDLVSCATASDPRLQLFMEEGLLPCVKADLSPGTDVHLTASAVELYGVLLKRTRVPLDPKIWECVEPLIAAVMRSDESGLLQNACDVLCSLINRSPSQLSDNGFLEPMLRCVERFLGPDLDDDACLYVGPLAMLVLAQYGSLIPADLTVGLLRALVTRLARAERPYLQQELVVVFARLLHQDLLGVLTALHGVQVPSSGTGGALRSGLELLLSIWLGCAKEIRARRARNVTVSALCRLHERCLEDEQLHAMQIHGLPLPGQLLATIVAGLEFENERCKKLKEHPLLDADGSEGGEDDESDDDDEFRAGGKLLSELVDLDDLEELSDDCGEGGDTFQELERADPLHQLDLQSTVAQYLAAHAACAAGHPELVGRLAAAVAEAQSGA